MRTPPADEPDTDRIEEQTHSFIVRFWLEASEPGSRVWRGSITHVPSGERHYVRRTGQISRVMWAYLRQPGVEPGWWERLRRWWCG